MHVAFLTNKTRQVGAKSTCIQSKTWHGSIIDKWQYIKKAEVDRGQRDVSICWYNICSILISVLFFLLVRCKNVTALKILQKICWGERRESYGTFKLRNKDRMWCCELLIWSLNAFWMIFLMFHVSGTLSIGFAHGNLRKYLQGTKNSKLSVY